MIDDEGGYVQKLYSLECEMCLLGSMILSGTAARRAVAIATAEMFWRPGHRLIFNAIKNGLERSVGGVDYRTIIEELGPNLMDAGGENYILQVAEFVPSPVNWDYYLGIVSQLHMRRQLVKLGQDALDPEFQVGTQSLLEVMRPISPGQPKRFGEIEDATSDRRYIATGCPYVDQAIPGFLLGGTHVALMGSGTGKSWFAIRAAINAARQGFGVLYLSLADLTEQRLASRALHAMTGWSRKPDSGEPLARWHDAYNELHDLPIWWHDCSAYRGGNKLSNIMALAEEYRRRKTDPCRLVIIDYVQMITPEGRDRYGWSVECESELRLLANRIGVAMLFCSQMTENNDGRMTVKGGAHWNEGAEWTLEAFEMPIGVYNGSSSSASDIRSRCPDGPPLCVRMSKNRAGKRPPRIYARLGTCMEIEEICKA